MPAFASGQEIIFVACFELILIIIFFAVLWKLKLTIKGKLLMFIVYILSMYLTIHFTNTGSYFENLALINISVAIIPSLITYGAYLILKNKFQKK